MPTTKKITDTQFLQAFVLQEGGISSESIFRSQNLWSPRGALVAAYRRYENDCLGGIHWRNRLEFAPAKSLSGFVRWAHMSVLELHRARTVQLYRRHYNKQYGWSI